MKLKETDIYLLAAILIAIGIIAVIATLAYIMWQLDWISGVLFSSAAFIILGMAIAGMNKDLRD